jgi:hypothetical protein
VGAGDGTVSAGTDLLLDTDNRTVSGGTNWMLLEHGVLGFQHRYIIGTSGIGTCCWDVGGNIGGNTETAEYGTAECACWCCLVCCVML